MKISERIQNTLEAWSELWRERLRTWLVGIFSFSLEVFMDILGKSFAPKLSPFIDAIEATGKVPPELQPLLDEMRNPTGEVGAIFAQSAGSALVGGAFGKIVDGILLPMAYAINSKTQNVILSEGQYIVLWLRKVISDEQFNTYMTWLGHNNEDITNLKEMAMVRLSPDAVQKLWLRNKTGYESLWKDLADSGISPDRIEHLKELAHVLPSPQELTAFMAHEVFEEDMVQKYGLDAEYETLDLSWFEKVGVRPEVAKMYWRNHWQHPALRTMQEFYHRGLITQEDFWEWFRLVEIPPHWRDKLIETAWDLPNRIELRMMARYGLVDKPFLVEMLGKAGLHPDYRSVAADMMLAMGIRTDISTRYGKGWLDKAGVSKALADSGLSETVQTRMYQWIIENVSEERVVKERDLTQAEIVKGVKKGVLSPEQGISLLMQMGYDEWEAEYKLTINVEALSGSPEVYKEFERLVALHNKALGKDVKIPSQTVIEAEKVLVAAEAEVKRLKAEGGTAKEIADAERAVTEAGIAYKQLLSAEKAF